VESGSHFDCHMALVKACSACQSVSDLLKRRAQGKTFQHVRYHNGPAAQAGPSRHARLNDM
ncbi:MAG: hypothetical protein ACTH7H_04495, partial [Cobetia crustatorum]